MANDYSGITRPYGDTPRTVQAPATDLNQSDLNEIGRSNSPDTGDLRRSYNFGNDYTKLSYQRDPYLHFLNMMRKVPTDDPKFKSTTRRGGASLRRFGYVVGLGAVGEVCTGDLTEDLASGAWNSAGLREVLQATAPGMSATSFSNSSFDTTQGNLQAIMIMCDYARVGQLQNRVGTTVSATVGYQLGGAGTKPNWFHPNQMIQIPVSSTAPADAFNTPTDYVLARIISIFDVTASNTAVTYGEGVILNCRLIKTQATHIYPTSYYGASWDGSTNTDLLDVSHSTGTSSLAQKLEPMRTYVSGSAYHELSGYGESHRDQLYSTDYGLTQEFKETAMMSYRAMSTVLKFEKNPWTEECQDKMLSINLQLAYTSYFGEQYEDADGITYTEGIINYILNNGNQFALSYADKDVDDFLEDMSAFNDPRFKPDMGMNTYYFVPTRTWNWLAKQSGYMKNNVEISPNYRMQMSGSGKKLGVPVRVIDVDGTSMKVVRDVNLDRTNVKMVAIDMNGCAIRPLVGNGYNNDVSVHVGVKDKKNSGESYRVDLIDADIGFKHKIPELHAVWV